MKTNKINIDKLIEENYKLIYDKAEKAAMIALPVKRGWGYNTHDLGEETDFILDLVKNSIKDASEESDGMGWCGSGFYMVFSQIIDKKLTVNIFFELSEMKIML